MPLQAEAGANERWLGPRVIACKIYDRGRVDSGDRRRSLRCPLRDALLEIVGTDRLACEKRAVREIFRKDDVHHRKGECCVGAGADLQIVVCALGRAVTVRIDHGEACAALACFLHERKLVNVGRAQIRAPRDDESRIHRTLRIRPGACAERVKKRGGRSSATDRAR